MRGHYPPGQIPFFIPPPKIFSIPVMALLTLPNMSLWILVQYIDTPKNTLLGQLKPYHALNLVKPVPTSPVAASVPLQPQQETFLVAKASERGRKAKRKESKEKDPLSPPAPKAPKLTPLCALCEVVGHATNNYPEFPCLKTLVHETFHESSISEVQVTLLGPIKKLKTLCTNHPCALCDHYGHYCHYFPCLNEFRYCLEAL